jgi:hypothetical protein
LIQIFVEGVLGASIGGAAGIITGNIALRIIDTRLGQPLLSSTTASFADVTAVRL